MGSNSERVLTPFLERCVNSKGKLAYKHFFEMTQEKRFVVQGPKTPATQLQDVTEIMRQLWLICNMYKDENTLKTLHHMYVSSVRNRELLPDGELDTITVLYESLKDFYETTAKEVRLIY